ncbi:UNVERIFIED_ORG: nicotinamidase-related amidase [Pseudomonas mohnii]|nr:nicotinamidase-related amidase [Pseudomonas mohnii]
MIEADRITIAYGYGYGYGYGHALSPQTIEYLQSLGLDRVLDCGLKTETCCVGTGLGLFDAGLEFT